MPFGNRRNRPSFLRYPLFGGAPVGTSREFRCGFQRGKSCSQPSTARIDAVSAGLTVSFPEDGSHSLEIATLQGKRVASRRGRGRKSYSIGGLTSGTVCSVATHGSAGSVTKLVLIP